MTETLICSCGAAIEPVIDSPPSERWKFEYRTASSNPKDIDYRRIKRLIEELGNAEAERDQARAEVAKARKDALEEAAALFDGEGSFDWHWYEIQDAIRALAAKDAQEGE